VPRDPQGELGRAGASTLRILGELKKRILYVAPALQEHIRVTGGEHGGEGRR
jgi:hypothetical protein